MRKYLYLIIAILMMSICSTLSSYAQAGLLDTTFNKIGSGFGLGAGPDGEVLHNTLQADGKIIICGYFTHYNNIARNSIARLNSDGSLDQTFDAGMVPNYTVFSTAVQSDGKIIAVGYFTAFGGVAASCIVRLNTNGSVDTSFHTGTGGNVNIQCVTIQNDGKILIGGLSNTFNGDSINYMARLDTSGHLDTTFHFTAANTAGVGPIVVQSNNQIVISRVFVISGIYGQQIARLNANGSLDPTFALGAGTGLSGYLNDFVLQSNGQIVIGGSFTAYNGTAAHRLLRLNVNGSIDGTFAVGSGPDSVVNAMAIQPNGQIVIGGEFAAYKGTPINRLARINTNGLIDSSFNFYGGGPDKVIYNNMIIQPDGRIIVKGDFTNYDGHPINYLARTDYYGHLDGWSVGPNGTILATAIQTDGKIIMGGGFSLYYSNAVNGICRVWPNGTFDSTFITSGISLSNGVLSGFLFVDAIAIQPDGKIIIGGAFSVYSGTATNNICRLNTDGSPDATFNTSIGADGQVKSIVIQPDGKILIGGNFHHYDGTVANNIARLNTNGSIDNSFITGTGTNGYTILSVALQNDGKIILGGYFGNYNGDSSNAIVRINSNGSFDNTFVSGCHPNTQTNALAIQSDGKILAGGMFYQYGPYNINVSYLIRLNSNGDLDTSFHTGSGPDGDVESITLMNDGKIILNGDFYHYDIYGRRGIARLLPNGDIDKKFDLWGGLYFVDSFYTGPSSSSSSIQADGKIIVGGFFDGYDGIQRTCIARLTNSTLDIDSFGPGTYCSGSPIVTAYSAPGGYNSGNVFTAQLSDSTGSFAAAVDIGSVAATTSGTILDTIPWATLTGSGYRIRVVSTSPADTSGDNGYPLTIHQVPTVSICLVTVDSNSNYNQVYWQREDTAVVDSYYIYRYRTTSYDKIAAVSKTALSEYIDRDTISADPNSHSSRYKISILDVCGVETPLSPYHNTIFINETTPGDLIWNQYNIENVPLPAPVDSYRVYRDDTAGNNNFHTIAILSNVVTTYVDGNSSLYPNAGYLVDVGWGISCDPTRSISPSRSNKKHYHPIIAPDSPNVSIKIIDASYGFRLYPNPADKSVTIGCSDMAHVSDIQITSLLGEDVYSGSIAPGQNKILEVSGYAKGIYLVKLQSPDGYAIKKLTVE